ncbi:MAG TPA: ATP-binding protein [Phycisphaerales bacterium]|nr:ATP-binding protein [Phycisphaerales bacterium]
MSGHHQPPEQPDSPQGIRPHSPRDGESAAHAAIQQSAHLWAIIDSAMDAIITVDESQTVVMFNRAAQRVFGVSSSAAVGMNLSQFIPDRFRKNHASQVRDFGRTGSTERSMGRLGRIFGLRSDGKEFPIEASISCANVGGRRYYTVILRDASEKQRLEAQLLQAQKMESVGRLAGGVAHDFNNLLMALFNYLALATRRLDEHHPVRQHLAQMQEVADRAAGLTRQLLAFARKQTLHPRPISPHDVVAAIEPLLRRMIGEDVTLRVLPAPDTGIVMADVSQLEQVLMNLAVNARDAMPSGGTLTIETSNVSLDEDYCRTTIGARPGEYVLISVTDTGAGMSPEVRARIFEPFFTTKAPGKGTGLGLATCLGIVSQQGGHIAVYSEEGRGTSIKVFLPRERSGSTQSKPDAPVPARPEGGTETILLAEDSPIVSDLAAAALREAGYTVLVAANGTRALALAKAHLGPIHLLIADAIMPEMGGAAMAEELTRTRPDTRVIFMSGYTEDTVTDHGVPKDAPHFLAKPFMTDDLLRLVRHVLDSPHTGAMPG